jgi:hypothetical protein
MIPKDRPVYGLDLENLRARLGVSAMDMSFILGISITKWSQFINHYRNEPIPSVGIEAWVRYLSAHPEANPLPKFPEPAELFDMIKGARKVTNKYFANATFRQSSSGYRWMTLKGRASPVHQRILYALKHHLASLPKNQMQNALIEWDKMVMEIGQARGIENVFKAGTWTNKATSTPEGREAKATKKAPKIRTGNTSDKTVK